MKLNIIEDWEKPTVSSHGQPSVGPVSISSETLDWLNQNSSVSEEQPLHQSELISSMFFSTKLTGTKTSSDTLTQKRSMPSVSIPISTTSGTRLKTEDLLFSPGALLCTQPRSQTRLLGIAQAHNNLLSQMNQLNSSISSQLAASQYGNATNSLLEREALRSSLAKFREKTAQSLTESFLDSLKEE